MVCSRGESLTHHRNQMTHNTRSYNHNVDIRSTQIADAGRSIAKGIEKEMWGLFGLFSVLLAIAWAGIIIQDIADRSRGVKKLNFTELRSDYRQNSVRAADTWKDRYLRYTGDVERISSSSVDVRNGDYEVSCSVAWFAGGPLKTLNKGDRITVIGERRVGLGTDDEGLGSDDYLTLENCEIS